jgi:hypothetical protein
MSQEAERMPMTNNKFETWCISLVCIGALIAVLSMAAGLWYEAIVCGCEG